MGSLSNILKPNTRFKTLHAEIMVLKPLAVFATLKLHLNPELDIHKPETQFYYVIYHSYVQLV